MTTPQPPQSSNPRRATARSQDDEIAELLRAGATYRHIRTTLGTTAPVIARVRKERDIPAPTGRPGVRRDPYGNDTAARDAAILDLLRKGVTHAEINRLLNVGNALIVRLRHDHKIPAKNRTARPAAAVEDVYARHARPTPDGHVHWDGPGVPPHSYLQTRGRTYSARRVAFRQHHGRDPEGTVTVTCEDPTCVAGAHLADRTIRQQQRTTTP